jgi:excisionase family DNA binding protein
MDLCGPHSYRGSAMQALLNVKQVAQEMGVVSSTVRQWCDSGELVATNIGRPGKRKEWRVARDDLDRFRAGRSNVLPARRQTIARAECRNLLGI